MVLIVSGVTDEIIVEWLKQRTWPPRIGALLICGVNPVTSAGLMTDADCERLRKVATPIRAAMRIVALWNSQELSPAFVIPHDFLLWCKYRNVSQVDWFLERVNVIVPGFIKSESLRQSNPDLAYSADGGPWGKPTVAQTESWSQASTQYSFQALPDETNQTPAGKSIDQYPVSGVIAEAFAGCLWNRTEWSGKLKDPGKRGWLVDARQAKSGAGTEGSRWNPIMIAVALNAGVQKRLTDSEKRRPEPGDRAQLGTRRVRKARLARVFEHTGLRDWASDWAHTEDLLDD